MVRLTPYPVAIYTGAGYGATEKVNRMAFKLVICPPNYQEHWPELLRQEIPDIDVHLCPTVGEAMEVIGDADAAFGDIVPELLERAGKLRWVACPQAGPRAGYYTRELITSDVVVTNTREIYNDHISRAHHGLPAGLRPRVPGLHPAAGAGRLAPGVPDHLSARGHGGGSGRRRNRQARPRGCAPSSE